MRAPIDRKPVNGKHYRHEGNDSVFSSKAMIFDLDGTLIYTPIDYMRFIITKAYHEVGGKKEISDDLVLKLWLETDRSGILKRDYDVDPAKFWPIFNAIDNPRRAQNSWPYDDAHVLLELKAMGYKLGILSGAPMKIVYDEVQLLVDQIFGGKNIFDIVACAGRGGEFKLKPDPQGLEFCLQKLGVSPSNSVFVGNGEEDVLTGLNAGVLTYLVEREDRSSYPYRGREPHVIETSLYPLRYKP